MEAADRPVAGAGRAQIRPAVPGDFDAIRHISEAVVAGGDVYVVDPGTPPEDTRAYWLGPGVVCFVAVDGEEVVACTASSPTGPPAART